MELCADRNNDHAAHVPMAHFSTLNRLQQIVFLDFFHSGQLRLKYGSQRQ